MDQLPEQMIMDDNDLIQDAKRYRWLRSQLKQGAEINVISTSSGQQIRAIELDMAIDQMLESRGTPLGAARIIELFEQSKSEHNPMQVAPQWASFAKGVVYEHIAVGDIELTDNHITENQLTDLWYELHTIKSHKLKYTVFARMIERFYNIFPELHHEQHEHNLS
jgi:hypothetical protein